MKATKSMIQRAKQSLFGRAVCKLAGDQTGAVMMEYVIVAVLIAAAALVAVMYFGKTVKNQFGTASVAVSLKSSDAADQQSVAEGTGKKAVTEGKDYANKFGDKQE
jgi:Flp pilus assembly pilin Flp